MVAMPDRCGDPPTRHAEAVDGCAPQRRDVVSQTGVLRMPSETPHRLPRRLRGFVMYGRARMVCPATNSNLRRAMNRAEATP